MGFLNDANTATITVKDAAGTIQEIPVSVGITDADPKGNVTLSALTDAAVGVIVLQAFASADGSLSLDTSALASVFAGQMASSGILTLIDPVVKANVADLYKAVKAFKKADRDHRLAIQAEAVATTESQAAISNAATTAAKLSAYVPSNADAKRASENLTNIAASEMDGDAAIASAEETVLAIQAVPAQAVAGQAVAGQAVAAAQAALSGLKAKKAAKAKTTVKKSVKSTVTKVATTAAARLLTKK